MLPHCVHVSSVTFWHLKKLALSRHLLNGHRVLARIKNLEKHNFYNLQYCIISKLQPAVSLHFGSYSYVLISKGYGLNPSCFDVSYFSKCT